MHIRIYTYVYIHMYRYVYIRMYIYVCTNSQNFDLFCFRSVIVQLPTMYSLASLVIISPCANLYKIVSLFSNDKTTLIRFAFLVAIAHERWVQREYYVITISMCYPCILDKRRYHLTKGLLYLHNSVYATGSAKTTLAALH